MGSCKETYDELKNNEVYHFASDDSENKIKWNREILSRIHDPKFDYKEDAPNRLWYHSTLISPIVSHYFKIQIIIFLYLSLAHCSFKILMAE